MPCATHPSARLQPVEPATVRLSEVISAMSCALDITEGQPPGHAVRTCVIGMRLAEELSLSDSDTSALFYALQLKDLGCSSNAEKMAQLLGNDDRTLKRDVKVVDTCRLLPRLTYIWSSLPAGESWPARLRRLVRLGISGDRHARTFIQLRCDRGAEIATSFSMPPATADAIRALDEHWDGRGFPLGLAGSTIPLLGRVLCLAQTVEVFVRRFGVDAAMDMAAQRSGSWFDPALVRALLALRGDLLFWGRLDDAHIHVARYEPADRVLRADDALLDRIAEGFARVIDAKSSWTYRHSRGVADISDGIALALGFDADDRRQLRRAALLHDVGKLGVSNQILDKPARLTAAELAIMRMHPAHSYTILQRVAGFAHLASTAAAHHERLDGRGYHLGLAAADLTRPMRILAVADVCEALSADRPYRETMTPERVLAIMEDMVGTALCPVTLDALKLFLSTGQYVPSRRAAD